MRKLKQIILLLFMLTSVMRAETLTPLGDGVPPQTVPQTVDELWAGYDPTAEPLETEILHQWEEDGVTLRVVRYRVGVFKGETAMVAGVYGFPTGQTNLPALLNIHGGGQFADYRSCLTNAKRGYATLSLAWAGRIAAPGYTVTAAQMQLFFDDATTDPNYKVTTDWGPLEGYHAPSRFPGSHNVIALQPAPQGQEYTFDDVVSPRNNTWFLWTMAARRGLTFLDQQPEVDGSKLGVYGHSMGGKLTVMTAGSDSRVKAAAPSCGGVSDIDREPLYDASVGDLPYLDRITCPVFLLKPSNDFHSHIADVPAAVTILEGNGNDWRVTTSPHHNHQDTAAYTVATQLWMDQQLKGGTALPDSPELQLILSNPSGVPSLAITGDNTTRPIQSVEVYYTQQGEDAGETHPFGDYVYRHWHSATVQGSNGSWTAELPVHSADEPLWVFANVTYALAPSITGAGYGYGSYTADEFVLSTPITSASSAELQTAGVAATLAATTVIEDFQGDWQKEWFNYSDDPTVWKMITHKVNDPVYAAPQYSKLAFEVRSDQANTLVLRMNDANVQVAVTGGNVWQEVVLYPLDFQNGSGDWAADWVGAKELEISSFVWNGTAPEFRDLHWKAGTREELDALRTNKLLLLPVEDGKVYLNTASAEEVDEIFPSVLNSWFGGAPLVVDGVTYPRGMTTHAPFEAVYFLGSAFDSFKAIATANSSLGTPLQMKVYLDEVLAFDSGDLVTTWAPVDLDVSGVSEMRLVVSYTGASSNGAHASWVDAHLTLPEDATQCIYSEDFEGSSPGAITVGTSAFSFGWDATDFASNPFTVLTLDVGATNGLYSNANNNIPDAGNPGPFVGGRYYGSMSFNQTVSADTGSAFAEGTEYVFSFLHYQARNTPVGGREITAEIYDVATSAVYATQLFPAVASYDNAETRSISYTAMALADGNGIGLRLMSDAIDYDDPGTALPQNENNFYGAGVDNIKLTATTLPPAVSLEVFDPADELAYAGGVSSSDLLHELIPIASGWVLGVNSLNDGEHGLSFDTTGTIEGAYSAVGAIAEFNLGSGANGAGYDITSIQSIAAWNSAAFGNQVWAVEVKPKGGSWNPLDTVDYQPLTAAGATRVVLADESGVLASGIEAIRFTANSAFVWRELDVFGVASAPEPVPPSLFSLSPDTPVDGSVRSNISTGTRLVAKFSEDVELGSGDITIVNLDTLAETVISLPDPQVSIDVTDGSLLMIEPGSDLLENTRYAVRIDATVIDDLSGNSFAGIGNDSTWTFATRGMTPLKVLCIGDSITVGYTDNLVGDPFNFGYRGYLYNLLNDAGYVFQYVGNSTQPWDGSFGLDPTIGGTHKPAFDLRDINQDYQQGGGGAPIGSVVGWLNLTEPDLILLKIGINSIQVGSDYNVVIGNIHDLVDAIVTQKPNAHLIVAQTIPYSGDYVAFPDNEGKNQMLHDYNVYIRDTLVPDFAAAGHKVSTVDMYSMFLTDPADYTSAVAIGRHSNSYNHPWNQSVGGAGYDVMAQRWFDAIEALNVGPDSFDFWLQDPAFGIDPSEQGFNDDPDGDGIVSGLEAWLGTNPGQADAYSVFADLAASGDGLNSTFVFSHSQNEDPPTDLSVAYEWSLDLVDWYAGDGVEGPPSGPTVIFSPSAVGSSTTVTGTASEVLGRMFVRAGVVLQN